MTSSTSPAPATSATTMSTANGDLLIGVLALQGAFLEHLASLRQLHIPCIEVRTTADLDRVDGLVIPGGESTTMALVAQREGLLEPLRHWSRVGRPVFGTCAGLILLANTVTNQKQGGQSLIGGLDVTVQRNHYGTQLGSFQTSLAVPAFNSTAPAVFIRAPGIARVSDSVEILASIPKDKASLPVQVGSINSHTPTDSGSGIDYSSDQASIVPVAVRQGSKLGTTFHPELTSDLRWHQLFVDMVRQHKQSQSNASQ